MNTQVVYERNGVHVTSTPVQHYNTPGPVALRLDFNGLSFTYSGGWVAPMRTREGLQWARSGVS